MQLFSKIYSFKKWIKYPVYLIFLLVIAFGLWSLSFPEKKNEIKNVQLGSIAENLAEVKKAENETIARLSDKNSSDDQGNNKKRAPSSTETKKTGKKEMPKKFRGNPAFQLFEKIEQLINQHRVTSPDAVFYQPPMPLHG